MIAFVNRTRRRLCQRGSERGSMAFLLLVTIVGVALGGLLIPIIISQDRTTRFDSTRVHALSAAQAGIDVVLGKIRSANTGAGTGVGDDGKLPCGPFSGNAVSSGTDGYYTEVLYYTSDPIANPSTKPMICSPNNGPFDPTVNPPDGTRTPRYACIISTGLDQGTPPAPPNLNTACASAQGSYGTPVNSGSKGRTLVTTYIFTTDDTNFSGGVIRIYPDGSGTSYCMDAGSAAPSAGTAITLAVCSTTNPPAAQQVFAYRTDLSIKLLSSVSTTYPNGLCLDTPLDAQSKPTAHTNNVSIVLNPCAIADTSKCVDITKCSPWNQQWSINDNSHLEGALPDSSYTDNYCINAAGQATGVSLTLQYGCAGSTSDPHQTWVPSPSAGAGMAGPTYGQLVNFALFANCLDVTGKQPTSTYLILYTCKQNPNPSKVAWNQIFIPYPALGNDATTRPTQVELVTTDTDAGNTRYCLTSPQTVGGYVTVQKGAAACPTTVPPAGSPALWTVYRTKDNSLNALPYDTKYVIKDSSATPLCLGLGPNSDLHIGVYLKIVTTICDGSTGQKWNADPSTGRSALQNTQER